MIANVHKVTDAHFFDGLAVAKTSWALGAAAGLPDHKFCIAKALNEIPNADVKQQVQLNIKAFSGSR